MHYLACLTAVVIALLSPLAVEASTEFMPESGVLLSDPTYCMGPSGLPTRAGDCSGFGHNTTS